MTPLRRYLKRHKISDADFGKLIGMGRQSVWRLAEGKNTPNVFTAMKIMDATGGKLTLKDLLS